MFWFLSSIILEMNGGEGIISIELKYTSPIKLNIFLVDEITLGIPGIPWCLFIYSFLSGEGCGYVIKATRCAICYYAQKALIAEALL